MTTEFGHLEIDFDHVCQEYRPSTEDIGVSGGYTPMTVCEDM